MNQTAGPGYASLTRRSHDPTPGKGMMSDSTRAVRRARQALPRPAGIAAAAVATTVLALLAVACGGSNSPGATGRSPGNSASASAVAYSSCMRSHGVPNYPDPGSDGNLPKDIPGA